MSIHLCVSAAEFKVILDRDYVIAPPQFASPDEARLLWIYFNNIHKIYSVQHSTVYIILM